MTPEQKLKNDQLFEQSGFKNLRIEITSKKHPHYGAVGRISRYEQTATGWGFVVKDENYGDEFFVFNKSDIRKMSIQ